MKINREGNMVWIEINTPEGKPVQLMISNIQVPQTEHNVAMWIKDNNLDLKVEDILRAISHV
jgi:hypothetical protein